MRDMERACPDPEVLARWLEDSLEDAARPGLTAHLAACDECRRTVALAADLESEFGVGAAWVEDGG